MVRHDIAVTQDSIFELTVQAQNIDGTPMNLTGYSGEMQIRETVDSSIVLMEATTANGRLAIQGPEGIVTILVPSNVTEPMTWSSGVWDLAVSSTGVNRKVLAFGNASFTKAVTRIP